VAILLLDNALSKEADMGLEGQMMVWFDSPSSTKSAILLLLSDVVVTPANEFNFRISNSFRFEDIFSILSFAVIMGEDR
jgi:hypothetical protein